MLSPFGVSREVSRFLCPPEAPGLGDPVEGTANLVLNPNGATTFNCHGALPAAATAPDRPVKVDLGDCDTILTPSVRARTICHSRP